MPQYDPTPGAGNTFANHEGNIAYTMDNSLAGTADFSSAVHTVKPLPNHDLTLTKTVTGKYGNRDKEFTFRLDTEQSWGPKLNRVCNYTKASGASGTITITDGVIEKVDGTPTDYLTLKHGQDITIGLPEGCRFTVTEEPKEEYTATEKVDGVDYNPITAAAAKSATGKADKKDGAQTGTITPKQGADILSGVLPKGGGIMSAGKVRTGDAGNRLKGVSYGPAASGVVEGTINTANVKVDYFNDKSALAPPTGITDVDGGSGLLPILLAGVAALGIGFCLWKRSQSS